MFRDHYDGLQELDSWVHLYREKREGKGIPRTSCAMPLYSIEMRFCQVSILLLLSLSPFRQLPVIGLVPRALLFERRKMNIWRSKQFIPPSTKRVWKCFVQKMPRAQLEAAVERVAKQGGRIERVDPQPVQRRRSRIPRQSLRSSTMPLPWGRKSMNQWLFLLPALFCSKLKLCAKVARERGV